MTYYTVVAREEYKEEEVLLYQGDYSPEELKQIATEEVRKNSDYRELPLILITSLASEEDKKRGADAGANAYIVKDQFNQGMLLETLDRLV